MTQLEALRSEVLRILSLVAAATELAATLEAVSPTVERVLSLLELAEERGPALLELCDDLIDASAPLSPAATNKNT